MTKVAVVASVVALAFASGCAKKNTASSDGDSSGSGDNCVEKDSSKKVGMAFDVGGRGDQSFNDSAYRGLQKASCEFGLTVKTSEAQDGEAESAREGRLREFADAGFSPIVAVGFAYSPSVAKVAKEYPDVNFAIVDDEAAKGDNIANLVFAEEQGSFLVGVAAALKTKSDHVGFVGGVETPLIQKFEAGYVAGVKAVDPKIKIDRRYLTQPPDFSGFGDPAKGKTAAAGMYDSGADIVYHAAGGSGGGVFEAAKAAGAKAIGVDSDQAKTADPAVQDVIMTSMIKRVDVAVYNYLKAAEGGEVPTGVTRYDLAKNGVAYSTTGGQIDDITDKLEEYKKKIVDGEITVPTKP
ncbi:MAG: BMP family lipoprotein [Nocardioidaceae bacterium]